MNRRSVRRGRTAWIAQICQHRRLPRPLPTPVLRQVRGCWLHQPVWWRQRRQPPSRMGGGAWIGCVPHPAQCTTACAQIMLPAASRCSDEDALKAALTAAMGAEMEAACQMKLADTIVGAPATVSVCGLRCNPDFEGEYILQPMPINGRPYWMKSSQGVTDTRHLYWTPSVFTSVSAWVIDDDTEDNSDSWFVYQQSVADSSPAWEPHLGLNFAGPVTVGGQAGWS
eukprot:SAG22_NODE_2078_length_3044_cov_1.691681_4_plen_226_part_00